MGVQGVVGIGLDEIIEGTREHSCALRCNERGNHASRAVLAAAADLKELKEGHYAALKAHDGFDDLPNFGICGQIVHAACMEQGSHPTVLELSGSVQSETQLGLICAPTQVLMPIMMTWTSPEGEYLGSSFYGYSMETILLATVTATGCSNLKWSAAARDVFALFECRKGPAFFHFGKASCRGQEYGLDLVVCPMESAIDGGEEVCHVRLALKRLGTFTPEVVVVDFKNCYATPTHHDFKQHIFVSGLLVWPKKELLTVLLARIEAKEVFTIEAKLGLF